MALSYGYDGFPIQGDINMDYHKITNLPNPTIKNEPITKGYADTHYSGGSSGLSDSGFTMQEDINMNGHKIINIPDPSTDTMWRHQL